MDSLRFRRLFSSEWGRFFPEGKGGFGVWQIFPIKIKQTFTEYYSFKFAHIIQFDQVNPTYINTNNILISFILVSQKLELAAFLSLMKDST